MLDFLSRYSSKDKKFVEAKNELLGNAKTFYKGRGKIIEGFNNGVFLRIKEGFHSNEQRPDSPASSDSSIDKSYGLTDNCKWLKNVLVTRTLGSWNKL